ncbi:hypothetical protein M405DRAFT_869883 [Rhizopogon salebrosus TDB-379]|nr:hypothetical protein M405DRAFT_869883 [Rhizopogon salebrosus TDB-379]
MDFGCTTTAAFGSAICCALRDCDAEKNWSKPENHHVTDQPLSPIEDSPLWNSAVFGFDKGTSGFVVAAGKGMLDSTMSLSFCMATPSVTSLSQARSSQTISNNNHSGIQTPSHGERSSFNADCIKVELLFTHIFWLSLAIF